MFAILSDWELNLSSCFFSFEIFGSEFILEFRIQFRIELILLAVVTEKHIWIQQ